MWLTDEQGTPNQTLHSDRGRIHVSRDTTLLQRPRRVNWCVRRLGGQLMDKAPIGLGATRGELRQLLGEPTDTSVPTRGEREPGIWKYGEIEYHFGDDGRVFLIYTEDENRNPIVLGEIRKQ
jgi:hypothetical protein